MKFVKAKIFEIKDNNKSRKSTHAKIPYATTTHAKKLNNNHVAKLQNQTPCSLEQSIATGRGHYLYRI